MAVSKYHSSCSGSCTPSGPLQSPHYQWQSCYSSGTGREEEGRKGRQWSDIYNLPSGQTPHLGSSVIVPGGGLPTSSIRKLHRDPWSVQFSYMVLQAKSHSRLNNRHLFWKSNVQVWQRCPWFRGSHLRPDILLLERYSYVGLSPNQ